MKKLFFIVAIAGVALVSCTKNELAPSATEQDEITFSTPVVAPSTKAIVDGVIYPKEESFGVYAWHNPSDAIYMNKVQVTRDASLRDDKEGAEELGGTEELGGWKPASAYYWPKTGSLDFDAFSPWSVNGKVSANRTNGITITGFEVADAADVDLMYATRTVGATTVNDGANTNVPYDGVDIRFNHALSAVQIMARTQSNYSATTEIKITGISIVSAQYKGTFNQNHGTTAAWTPDAATKGFAYTNQTVTYAGVDCGTKLLLPQAISGDDIAIKVTYTINGVESTGTFKFKDHKNGTCDGSPVTVESWEMGKRYIYTLVFTLDEIYFEPIVTDWVDVTMSDIIVS